jgi:hypothetical protein
MCYDPLTPVRDDAGQSLEKTAGQRDNGTKPVKIIIPAICLSQACPTVAGSRPIVGNIPTFSDFV